jgi:hypothetical protein
MLSDAYPFRFIQKDKEPSEGLDYVFLYRFRSKKSKLAYMVRVEEYKLHVYAVKFYLKNHSLSDDKYRIMTNTHEPRRIINTCINIMLSIYNKDPMASFGFIGANGFGEEVGCTKRYRVYSRIIATYFSDQFFYHKENISKSAYMLINNRSLKEDPTLTEKIEAFFMEQYDYFD